MRLLIRPFTFTIVVILLISVFEFSTSNAQNAYRYGFLVVTETEAYIELVDPENLNAIPERFVLTIPSGMSMPISALTSPDGIWTMIEFASADPNNPTTLIQLVDVVSCEVRSITNVYNGIAIGGAEYLSWSPDSNYLAMNVDLPNTGETSIIVYSLTDNHLNTLVEPERGNIRFEWSWNSEYIAVDRVTCIPRGGNCEEFIDIFRISDNVLMNSIELQEGASICNIQWSPDNLNISFAVGCFPSASVESFKEVYILNLVNQQFRRVTNYTIGAATQATPYLVGQFATLWYDSQTLLVGAIYATTNGTQNTESLAYSLNTSQATLITASAINNWKRNPTSDELAIERVEDYSTLNGYQFIPQNPSVQIASFVGATLNPLITGPAGCNLFWSPDGITLAYSRRQVPPCTGELEAIVFINKANNSVSEHTASFQSAQRLGFTIPLGWLEI